MVDVILIQPNIKDENANQGVPPLGLCYISSSLKKKGFTTNILDLSVKAMGKTELITYVKSLHPKVIGVSLMVSTYANGMEICHTIRENFSNIPIIVGGPHATCIPEEILKSSVVDIVNLFEGEDTFVELVSYYTQRTEKKLSNIYGIAFIDNNVVVKTPKRKLIADLDKIPFPDRDTLDVAKYQKLGTIVSGRGCIYSCRFCSSPFLCENKYRLRSVDNVVEEMRELYYKYNVREFIILDDTFIVDDDRVYEFCNKIKGMNITWSCYSRIAPPLSKELLREMRDSGLVRISFGVESGNNEILKSINKDFTVDDVSILIKTVHEEGILAVCYFMVGFPEDTHETISDTFIFANKLRAYGTNALPVIAVVGALTPMPKSYIYENREKLGIRILTYDWSDYNFFTSIIETRKLTNSELNRYLLSQNGGNMNA